MTQPPVAVLLGVGKAPKMERHGRRLRHSLLLMFAMFAVAGIWFARLSTTHPSVSPATAASMCAQYRTSLPPPVRAELAAQASEAIKLFRAFGTNALTSNATFMTWMKTFSVEEREYIANQAGNPTLYQGSEVPEMQAAEQAAVLRAAPLADLSRLNGVNIGAGGRAIDESLIALDAHRGLAPIKTGKKMPASQRTTASTLLAWADQLPFAPASLDYIVSLHNLEHLHDPVAAVKHYLDVLKPGGGLGVVIPHWQFAWDARHDDNEWGHRWNTAPEVVCALYHQHWADVAVLEQLSTLKYRVSFDFVLRKRGTFLPFQQEAPAYKTGQGAYCDGSFIGPHDMHDMRVAATC